MKITIQNGYKIIHLIDGELIKEAVKLINHGRSEGINFTFRQKGD